MKWNFLTKNVLNILFFVKFVYLASYNGNPSLMTYNVYDTSGTPSRVHTENPDLLYQCELQNTKFIPPYRSYSGCPIPPQSYPNHYIPTVQTFENSRAIYNPSVAHNGSHIGVSNIPVTSYQSENTWTQGQENQGVKATEDVPSVVVEDQQREINHFSGLSDNGFKIISVGPLSEDYKKNEYIFNPRILDIGHMFLMHELITKYRDWFITDPYLYATFIKAGFDRIHLREIFRSMSNVRLRNYAENNLKAGDVLNKIKNSILHGVRIQDIIHLYNILFAAILLNTNIFSFELEVMNIDENIKRHIGYNLPESRGNISYMIYFHLRSGGVYSMAVDAEIYFRLCFSRFLFVCNNGSGNENYDRQMRAFLDEHGV